MGRSVGGRFASLRPLGDREPAEAGANRPKQVPTGKGEREPTEATENRPTHVDWTPIGGFLIRLAPAAW